MERNKSVSNKRHQKRDNIEKCQKRLRIIEVITQTLLGVKVGILMS